MTSRGLYEYAGCPVKIRAVLRGNTYHHVAYIEYAGLMICTRVLDTTGLQAERFLLDGLHMLHEKRTAELKGET